MIGALNEVASTAEVSGVSLQKAEGYITAIGVSTGKESSEVGNSVRSMLAKIYKPKAQDTLEQEAGVSVKDEMGEYKKAGDVLDELNTKWSTLSYTQQVNLAQSVGGIQRYNDFMSLMNNYQMSLDATSTALNSQGSAEKENAIYMDTAQAKLQQLKTTLEEVALRTINSDFLKGGIDGLKGLVEAFDSLPTVVGLATAGLTIFNTKFRDSVQMFSNMIPPINNLNNKITQLGEKWKASSVTNQGYANTLKESIIAMQTAGTSTAGFGAKLTVLNTKIAIAKVGMVALQVATMAMQVAMSVGLSLVITGVISLVDDLIHKNEKLAESTSTYLDSIKANEESISSTNKLLEQKKSLESQILKSNITEEESLDLKTQLVDIEKQIATALPESISGYTTEGEKISANNGLIQKQLDLKKEQIVMDAKSALMQNNTFEEDEKQKKITLENIRRLNEAKLNGEDTFKPAENIDSDGNYIDREIVMSTGSKAIKEYADDLTALQKKSTDVGVALLSMFNQGYTAQDIAGMKELGWSTEDVSNAMEELGFTDEQVTQSINGMKVSLDSTKTSADGVQGSTNSLKEGLEDLEKQADATAKKFKDMTDAFSTANNNIKLLESVREEFSKSGGVLSGETIEKIFASGNTDIIALLGNSNTLMDESGNLLGTLKTNQKGYYDEVVKSAVATKDKTKAVVEGGKTETKVVEDTSNNIMKANAQVGANLAIQYGIDAENRVNAENEKAKAIEIIDNSLLEINANITSQLAEQYKTDADNFAKTQQDKLNSIIAFGISAGTTLGVGSDALTVDPNTKIKSNLNIVQPNYNPVGIGSADSGSGSKSSSSTAKEVENMKNLVDRYYELDNAISDLNSRYTLLGTLKENTYGSQYTKYLNEEIALLEKQKQAVSNMANAVKTERYELMRDLGGSGFTFGSQGEVTNYQTNLKRLQDIANASSQDVKENQIKAVEEISAKLENYTDLTINKTNEMSNQWYELSNKIKDSYRAMAEAESKTEQDTAKAYEHALQKRFDVTKEYIDKMKEKINTVWDEADWSDEKQKAEQVLLDIKSQIDDAVRSGDRSLLSDLQKQYGEQQKTVNDMISKHEREVITDKIDKKETELDDQLAEMLKPENLNQTIQTALQEGYFKIGDEIISVQSALKDMVTETTTGFETTKISLDQYLSSLATGIELTKQLGNINAQIGLVSSINNVPVIPASAYANINNNANSKTIQINSPLIHVDKVDSSNMAQMESMVDTKFNNLIKAINEDRTI